MKETNAKFFVAMLILAFSHPGHTAKVHFASRREGANWRTIIFNVVRDDGVTLNLDQQSLTDTGAPVMALSS